TSRAVATALVDVEIWSEGASSPSHQVWFDGQSFVAGEQRGYNATWDVPSVAPTGRYRVAVLVYSPDWATIYARTDSAATFSVGSQTSPSPTATPPVVPTATV